MNEARVWNLVDATGDCWEWQGTIDAFGYGLYNSDRHYRAHRLVYEVLVGPIPDGLTLDHLCRNRRCVNPAHLQAVSIAENALRGFAPPAMNARKSVCKSGSPFVSTATTIGGRRRVDPDGGIAARAFGFAMPSRLIDGSAPQVSPTDAGRFHLARESRPTGLGRPGKSCRPAS